MPLNFEELHNLYGIDFNKEHWIPTKNPIPSGLARYFVKNLRVQPIGNLPYRIQRACIEPECVNPWHYRVTIIKKFKNNLPINDATMLEIVEEIEPEKIAKLGLKRYLQVYNDSQPIDLLKIDLATLKKAYEIRLAKELSY